MATEVWGEPEDWGRGPGMEITVQVITHLQSPERRPAFLHVPTCLDINSLCLPPYCSVCHSLAQISSDLVSWLQRLLSVSIYLKALPSNFKT